MTVSDLYCSRADVARRLTPGAIASPAGIVASSVASTNAITYDGHGLETDDEVTLRATDGGTLSAPLVAGTVYFAIRLTNAAFSLAATAGGAAIDLTTDGVSMVVTREPRFDETIEFYSRWADSFLPAHVVPLTAPIHPLVRGIVADLAAKKLLATAGQSSEILGSYELAAKAQLERFAANGIPLRGAPATASANQSITRSAVASDSRGWGSGMLP